MARGLGHSDFLSNTQLYHDGHIQLEPKKVRMQYSERLGTTLVGLLRELKPKKKDKRESGQLVSLYMAQRR